jgi:hypothetical protein
MVLQKRREGERATRPSLHLAGLAQGHMPSCSCIAGGTGFWQLVSVAAPRRSKSARSWSSRSTSLLLYRCPPIASGFYSFSITDKTHRTTQRVQGTQEVADVCLRTGLLLLGTRFAASPVVIPALRTTDMADGLAKHNRTNLFSRAIY